MHLQTAPFTVRSNGALMMVDTAAMSSGGNIPLIAPTCPHVTGSVSPASGAASFIPTEGDGLHFSDHANTWTFPHPTTGNQGVVEPHMAYEHDSEVLAPDKGNDKIWPFGQIDGKPGDYVVHDEIQQPIDSGPRHIRIRDKMLYTIHELASTLTLQEVPSYPNSTSQIPSNVSIIPLDPPAGPMFAATEILIPETTAAYLTPYIYVSNRNTGVRDPRGDTIAIFENVDDQLVLSNQVHTGLNQVRGMISGEQVGFGGEAYIVAAGVASTAGVKVFKRTECGANLKEVAVDTTIATRLPFVWLNQYQMAS